MQDLLFEKMKPTTKKRCIYAVLASFMGLLGAIFLMFLPIMSGESLVGIEHDYSINHNYSIVDDIKRIIETINSGDHEHAMFAGILMLIPYFVIIVGIIWTIIDMIKGIWRIVELDDYVMEMYDKIINGVDDRPKSRRANSWDVTSVGSIIMGFAFLIFYKYLFKADAEFFTFYGYGFSGFSWVSIVPVLFFVAMIVLECIGKFYKKLVKMEILKTKYETPFQ